MNQALVIAGLVFVALAALLHIGFFALESLLWSRPAVWRHFGVRSQEDAETVRGFAYNQGFYNLFLALGAAASIPLLASPAVAQAGFTLALFTMGSMVFAAIVLLASNRRLLRGAVIQGVAPLLAIVLLLLSLT